MNIFKAYGSSDAAKGNLGLHRLIEATKHMFAARMNLGDPNFVNISNAMTEMLSPSFAKQIQEKIFDNTTFPPDYYMNRYDDSITRVLDVQVWNGRRAIFTGLSN